MIENKSHFINLEMGITICGSFFCFLQTKATFVIQFGDLKICQFENYPIIY